ncbi:MAG: FAD:protein FMN transferase [Acidimicrobiia bacterium]|nr:FAD:protein FMN transferase [Acidimicrobiia bacterium]
MTTTSNGTHHVEHVMGTAVSIDIRDPHCSPDAVMDVVGWLHHVDRTFSTYDNATQISALGRGDITLAEATDEVRDVLRMCEVIRTETADAFDAFDIPAPNGTRLDPSGLVKGWAIEQASGILEEHGCENLCINAGGDIAIRGHPLGMEPWRVGIRHPEMRDAVALVVKVSERCAVATSATYERGPHIIDPRSGDPALNLASVTVIGPNLGIADAYATAIYVMGLGGLEWIEGHAGYDAYAITHHGSTSWSSGFNQYRLCDKNDT